MQHADKLAALERREADLRAQLNGLANDAQEFKNKDGVASLHHQHVYSLVFMQPSQTPDS